MGGKRFQVIFLFVILSLSLVVPQASTQEVVEGKGGKLEVRSFKNIEVFCTLINLTDYWEKRPCKLPFAIEARNRFLPFKDHPAVEMTEKFLEKRWVWHSFFCHMALEYSDLPQAELLYQPRQASSNRLFNWIITRYFQGKADDYIPMVRDFYEESGYEEFWKENRGFYEHLKANLEEKIKGVDIPGIMEDFYGMKKERYFIVPAPQMPSMGLNVEVLSAGKPLVFDVQGPFRIGGEGADYFVTKEALIDTAFHEFGHTFLEPVLDRHKRLLKKHSYIYEKLKEENRKKMRRRGYPSWDRVFIENLIRAVQVRLHHRGFGEEFAQKVLELEIKKGFQLVPILYDIMDEYENNRDKYKDFEAFFPNLFMRLGERIKK